VHGVTTPDLAAAKQVIELERHWQRGTYAHQAATRW
jgi:hypothetical protein